MGFALTEAIASFAPMMAFLISSVFRSKKFHSYNSLFEADSLQCSFYRYWKDLRYGKKSDSNNNLFTLFSS